VQAPPGARWPDCPQGTGYSKYPGRRSTRCIVVPTQPRHRQGSAQNRQGNQGPAELPNCALHRGRSTGKIGKGPGGKERSTCRKQYRAERGHQATIEQRLPRNRRSQREGERYRPSSYERSCVFAACRSGYHSSTFTRGSDAWSRIPIRATLLPRGKHREVDKRPLASEARRIFIEPVDEVKECQSPVQRVPTLAAIPFAIKPVHIARHGLRQ